MTDQSANLASLKPLPLNEDEPQELEFAHGDAAAGMGGEGEPAQLDILWRNGRTLVYPAKVPDGFAHAAPWAFEGRIEPHDCIASLRAQMAAATEPKA